MSKAGNNKNTRRSVRAFAGGLCRIIGTLLLLLVITAYLPLTIPRMFGYEIYEVVSGSMEPEIPVESVVYVQSVASDVLRSGEIIAFNNGSDMPVVHRVVTNDTNGDALVTKGDANKETDMSTVEYHDVIGKVVYHLPFLGIVAHSITSGSGKLYALGVVVAAALLQLVAGLISRKN